eukprot:11058808-Alexandrium_andersonii.AAC.1
MHGAPMHHEVLDVHLPMSGDLSQLPHLAAAQYRRHAATARRLQRNRRGTRPQTSDVEAPSEA